MLAPVAQDQKKTEYDFELISGNMKAVHYQKDEIDGYTHFYHYDELNRLKEVETTTDNDVHRSTEARYQYYDYGPLARVELGEYQVQGMDYAYTINGWIKGMNSNTLDPGRDMGKDSRIGYLAQNQKVHLNFAKDVFGFTVNYFDGDYSAVGGSSFEAEYSGTALGNYNQDLFNGNIRHVVTAIEGMEIQGYGYKYDQLQRLKEMQVFRDNNLVANNNWSTSQATNDYLTKFSYDKNGNLLNLNRNGYGTELDMDRFVYNYLTINGERSNRLDYVNDTGTDYASYDDIKTGQSTGNYTYNRIGELTEDVQENMELHWRYGDHKLQKIERTDADSPEVEFFYNPLGVRVGKLVKPRQNGDIEPQNSWTYYYYAYDANGQLMAVYDSKLYSTNGETILEEQYIYGSDRIGSIQKGLLVFDNNAIAPSNDPYVENTLGQKRYELKNYLGTVNVTISDRKTYDDVEDVFEATVTNYAETYAFGMLMPNRSFNADGQRHLYHGMEQDVEVSGSGNSYTTEFRQYDPRLGRWKSLDPLMSKFPDVSPYNAFANNPIFFTDPYGLEPCNDEGGDGNDGGGDIGVTVKEEVTITAERTTKQTPQEVKMDRAMGEGKWAEGGEFSKDYGSENWKYFINNENWSTAISQESKDRDSRTARSRYYDREGITFPQGNASAKPSGLAGGGGGIVFDEESQKLWTNMDAVYELSEYVALGAIVFPTAVIIGSSIATQRTLSFFGKGLRMYHTTIGMNGGYANTGLNWINQSYIQGGGTNYFSFEGKSITGLIMAGSFRYNSSISGQMMVGAADPWINLSFSGDGLTSAGYFLNSSGNKPSFQKTTALSIMGTFNSIYMGGPLMKSGLGNTLIGNGLMAPGQNAVTNVKD